MLVDYCCYENLSWVRLTYFAYVCLYHYNLVTEKFLENIHTMLNEPSVGLYRMQEHVRRSLPQLVDKKVVG